MAGPRRLLGRCPMFFLLAAGFDAVGLGLILLGIFAHLELSGRSFGEFLIYGGGIMIFFSLLWWLAWYSLNLEVSLHELLEDPQRSPKKSRLVHLARKISERLSRRGRGFSRETMGTPNLPGEPLHFRPPVFINLGFNRPLRVCEEEHMEMSPVTEDPLAPCPITQDPLAPCRVTEDRVAPCRVTEDRVAPCRVTEDRVAPCRVTEDRVAPCRVTEDRVAPCRVTEDRVAPCRVTEDRVAPCRVTEDRVARCRVTEDHLALCLVTKDRVAPCRVTEDHLALCLVTKDLLELSPLPALNQHTVDRLV